MLKLFGAQKKAGILLLICLFTFPVFGNTEESIINMMDDIVDTFFILSQSFSLEDVDLVEESVSTNEYYGKTLFLSDKDLTSSGIKNIIHYLDGGYNIKRSTIIFDTTQEGTREIKQLDYYFNENALLGLAVSKLSKNSLSPLKEYRKYYDPEGNIEVTEAYFNNNKEFQVSSENIINYFDEEGGLMLQSVTYSDSSTAKNGILRHYTKYKNERITQRFEFLSPKMQKEDGIYLLKAYYDIFGNTSTLEEYYTESFAKENLYDKSILYFNNGIVTKSETFLIQEALDNYGFNHETSTWDAQGNIIDTNVDILSRGYDDYNYLPKRINIESNVPGIPIYVDDEYIGDTPTAFTSNNPDNYTIKAVKEGYESREKTVYLNYHELENQTVSLTMGDYDIEPRTVIIQSKPTKHAEVYINGDYLGTSPVSYTFLGKKKFQVALAANGVNKYYDVDIQNRGKQVQELSFDAEPREIEITSTPSTGVDVYIDDSYAGQTPLSFTKYGNDPFQGSFSKNGIYNSYNFSIDDSKVLRYDVPFDAEERKITITSSPNNSSIYLNGSYIGESPLTTTVYTPSVSIKVDQDNYFYMIRQVSLDGEQKTYNEHFTLEYDWSSREDEANQFGFDVAPNFNLNTAPWKKDQFYSLVGLKSLLHLSFFGLENITWYTGLSFMGAFGDQDISKTYNNLLIFQFYYHMGIRFYMPLNPIFDVYAQLGWQLFFYKGAYFPSQLENTVTHSTDASGLEIALGGRVMAAPEWGFYGDINYFPNEIDGLGWDDINHQSFQLNIGVFIVQDWDFSEWFDWLYY